MVKTLKQKAKINTMYIKCITSLLRSTLTFLVLFIAIAPLGAQAIFTGSGKIEFEKSENMHKQWGDNEWTVELKKNYPMFKKTYFNLYFTDNKTYYEPGRENTESKFPEWGNLATDNKTFIDLENGKATQFKQIFEEKYLIQDSALNIEWKLMDETRTIAGLDCRKALGRFSDSLYVVAFYTDQITCSGGPEGFSGLPGMILGLAFPRLHTTWFATRIENLQTKDVAAIKPPATGKKVNRSQMMATVKELAKKWSRWDDEADKMLWYLSW